MTLHATLHEIARDRSLFDDEKEAAMCEETLNYLIMKQDTPTCSTTHHLACACREAKFAELERENAELREHHQRDEALIVQRTDEIRHLEKELAALREDKARIDWLETKSAKISKITYGPSIAGERWVIDERQNYFGITLRAAIDAARKEGAS